MQQCLMSQADLQKIMKKVFKKDYEVMTITRLLGGAQKGTYKVECSNEFAYVLYIWDASLSYFENVHTEEAFTSNSAFLFKQNYDLLTAHHIRVPELYHIDLSKAIFPFEYALVQYIDGGELEDLLYNPQVDTTSIMMDLKENMRKLHCIKSSRVGDLKYTREEHFSCKAYIKESLDDALLYLFEHYEPIARLKKQLIDVSHMLYAKIEERKEYALIHFELGPNHVMVDQKGHTYLIDFEGMKYFDLEYEYSFLQLRFGKYYSELSSLEVDNHRMKYYLFYHHIAAIEGAYQLLTQDYYNLEAVNNMIHYNYEAILKNYL